MEIPKGRHGSNFAGNPLACSAGIATIDFMLANDRAAKAEEKGSYFLSELNAINSDKIRSVRGKGLMIGIELKEKVQPSLLKLIGKGVLALPAGTTVIRLLPPLVMETSELDFVVEQVQSVLT